MAAGDGGKREFSYLTSVQNLSEIQLKKVDEFKEIAQQRLNGELNFIIFAPGRVNLIGEHVDYHNFPVLPIAIESSVLIGVRILDRKVDNQTEESQLEFSNFDQESFPTWSGKHSFEYGPKLCQSHQWYHYILCAYHGLLAKKFLKIEPTNLSDNFKDTLSEKQIDYLNAKLKTLNRLRLFIKSDLPIASGLSSSSALVCGSSLAISLLLNDFEINREELADDCAKFERLVGVHGGGMDQAVIMTAQQGFAKYIEFSPKLSCDNIRLPAEAIWLVSHCGFKYAKAATSGYNMRVLETKFAASLIAKHFNLDHRNSPIIQTDKRITLNRIKSQYFNNWPMELILDYVKMQIFKGKIEFTLDEICLELKLTLAELSQRFEISEKFINEQLDGKSLNLFDRFDHVLMEALNTETFKQVCETTGDIKQLGKLMIRSHESLRDKYECSHPALDKLVEVALEGGALGSRLTGAGWGGCVVSLVDKSKKDLVFERLKKVSKFTFETSPQSGCQVIKIGLLDDCCMYYVDG